MDDRSTDFAQLVALLKEKEGPPHLLNLWLADTGSSQGLTSLDLRDLSVDRLSGIRSQVIRRLGSHTRGILELSKDDNVEFLHRTTLDWANGKEIWSEISSHLNEDFDAPVELMHAEGLMTWRKLEYHRRAAELSYCISPVLYEVLRYAHKAKSSPRNTQRLVQILEALQRRHDRHVEKLGDPSFETMTGRAIMVRDATFSAPPLAIARSPTYKTSSLLAQSCWNPQCGKDTRCWRMSFSATSTPQNPVVFPSRREYAWWCICLNGALLRDSSGERFVQTCESGRGRARWIQRRREKTISTGKRWTGCSREESSLRESFLPLGMIKARQLQNRGKFVEGSFDSQLY